MRKSNRVAHVYCTGASIIAKPIQFVPFKPVRNPTKLLPSDWNSVFLVLQEFELKVSFKEPVFFFFDAVIEP